MNGRKAKELRREIYGEMSTKDTRYTAEKHMIPVLDKEGKRKHVKKITISTTGLRRKYQQLKREKKSCQSLQKCIMKM